MTATEMDDELRRLVITSASFAYGARADPAAFPIAVDSLAQIEQTMPGGGKVIAKLDELLRRDITYLLERGWQPADVAHAAKRQWNVKVGRLVVQVLAAEARRTDALDRAPARWVDQLEELGVHDGSGVIIGGHADLVARWARAERLHPEESIELALKLLAWIAMAPSLPLLLPRPSEWGATNKGVAASRSVEDVDARALKVIRALLAKAEASTFDAEAESFTAKAQELMTRHSIDAAMLAASASHSDRVAGVESLRVHVDRPYAHEKATFLSMIAEVNGARAVWSDETGIVTVMGFPVDLRLTDMLFTSLLVQATHASAAAIDRRASTPSFRRAFLVSFANRIAERLEETKRYAAHEAQEQYGSALLPVLVDRAAAVDEAYETAFPNVTKSRARSFNAAGWYAGRAAADRADIGIGEALNQ